MCNHLIFKEMINKLKFQDKGMKDASFFLCHSIFINNFLKNIKLLKLSSYLWVWFLEAAIGSRILADLINKAVEVTYHLIDHIIWLTHNFYCYINVVTPFLPLSQMGNSLDIHSMKCNQERMETKYFKQWVHFTFH